MPDSFCTTNEACAEDYCAFKKVSPASDGKTRFKCLFCLKFHILGVQKKAKPTITIVGKAQPKIEVNKVVKDKDKITLNFN